MKFLFLLAAIPLVFVGMESQGGPCSAQDEFVIVVHGGAGSWNISQARQREYRRVVGGVLQEAGTILENGGRALDAVQKAVEMMEDSPMFNAGRGAIRNDDNVVELDASIMDGRNRNAGAVGAVKTIKNPIHAARTIMEKSQHLMLVSPGAENYVGRNGVTIVDPSYFDTKPLSDNSHKFGTVGAVVLDRCGDLAAGTSTGGWNRKLPGRVGDSPIIGAGTYADNNTCAVSGTGHGEYFMRALVSHDIAAMMEYLDLPLAEAARRVVKEKLVRFGGDGGVIAVDAAGNIATPFNTRGMLRGYLRHNGESEIAFR